MTPFKTWMQLASSEEQAELAAAVGSSRAYLYQISGGFKQCSAGRASAIERKTQEMAFYALGRLPVVYRTELASACAGCEYARECLHLEPDTRNAIEIEFDQMAKAAQSLAGSSRELWMLKVINAMTDANRIVGLTQGETK